MSIQYELNGKILDKANGWKLERSLVTFCHGEISR